MAVLSVFFQKKGLGPLGVKTANAYSTIEICKRSFLMRHKLCLIWMFFSEKEGVY